jgi:hypothetical protein
VKAETAWGGYSWGRYGDGREISKREEGESGGGEWKIEQGTAIGDFGEKPTAQSARVCPHSGSKPYIPQFIYVGYQAPPLA